MVVDDVTDKDGKTTQKGVELGAKNYDVNSYLDGEPSVTLAIFQLPGSNALKTAEAIKAKMEELKASFPEGVDYRIVYDTTVFIDESIHEVFKTLFEAFVLVFIVVLVFLQDWRATIIPMIAVPVSLIGTFAVMALLGFSLNNLSLFGLVLAIGIVVDDAIVVVENVERWMAQGPAAARGEPQGDGRGDRPGHRHRPGALRGVRADGVHGRHQRPVLQAVRPDHRRLDDHLGVQLADPQPGPVRHPAQAARARARGPGPQEALPRLGVAADRRPGRVRVPARRRSSATCSACRRPAATASHDSRRSTPPWCGALRAGLFAAGCVAGWLAAGLVNWLLGRFFVVFNKAFDVTISGYGAAVRLLLRLQRRRPGWSTAG